MSSFLKHKFAEIKKTNPLFSIRAFAQRAGLSSGAMSEIINGKRSVSVKLAEKISIHLKLNPTERALFFAEIQQKRAHLGLDKKREVTFLSRNQFQFLTESHHFALLCLVRTKDFRYDLSWISRRLGISEAKTKSSIERMLFLKMLKVENNSLQVTNGLFSTTDDIKDVSIQAAHVDGLNMAKRSLLRDSPLKRDFTALSFPADPELIPLVKEKIRLFQDEIEALFENRNNTEVYKLAVYFFPQSYEIEGAKVANEN